MVQKRNRTRRKRYWLLLVLIFVVTGVVCGLLWYFGSNKEGKSGVDENVVNEKNTEVIEAKESIRVEDPAEKKVVQYEGGDPNEMEGLSGVITYASVSDGYLRIRLNIDQFLNGGACMLRILSGDNVVYTEVASIIGSASTSTCEGFDIEQSKVGVGDFQVEVLIESGGKSGKIIGGVSL